MNYLITNGFQMISKESLNSPIKSIKRFFFQTPSFLDDENLSRASRVLNLIILNYWLIVLISFSFLFIAVRKQAVFILTIFFIVFCLIVEVIKNRNQIFLAGKVLLSGVWLLITLICLLEGTVLNVFSTWYISLAIVVAILLGKKTAYLFTLITLLATLGIVILNFSGILTEPFFPVPPLVSWFVFIIALVQTITPINLVIKSYTSQSENLEVKVLDRTKELEKVNNELELYINSLSHDLRTPLEILDEMIDVFKQSSEGHLSESEKQLINRISMNSKRTNKLSKDLLQFLTFRNLKLRKEDIFINDLLKNVQSNFSEEIRKRNIDISVEKLPNCEGDPTLITQLWINLLSNALKYTKKRQDPKISIGYKVENGKNVYFIKDNGIGFDMTKADKIFQPFFRLSNEKEYEGSGIGLAFVHSIILKHGGRIWFDSKINEGTIFYFTLG